MPGHRAVEERINIRPPVLDAHPDGNRLGDHLHLTADQHPVGVPGTVSRGQDQKARRQAPPVGTDREAAVRQAVEGIHPATVHHLTPETLDLIQHPLNHLPEHIRAHMGLGLEGNVLRCAHLPEGLQDQGAPAVIDACQQLPVREGTCTSRTELDVGLGVQDPPGAEPLHGLHPILHAVPPVYDQRCKARPGQEQGAEQTRRSHAHHKGACGQGFVSPTQGQMPWCVGLGSRPGQLLPGKAPAVLPDTAKHRIYQFDVPLVAGIHGLLIKAKRKRAGLEPAPLHLLCRPLQNLRYRCTHRYRHASITASLNV